MKSTEDYKKFLADVRKETGIEALTPDDGGLVSVRVDDRFNVNLQFVEATGKVLCFVEVAQLSADASKNVYRDLLAGGLFGKETAGGYFALEPDTETVVYNYFFDFERAAEDTEDFVATLEKILQLCDIWAERIKDGGELEYKVEVEEKNNSPSNREFELLLKWTTTRYSLNRRNLCACRV